MTGCPARLVRVVGTLRRAGFPIETTLRAFSVLDSFVYGFGRQQLGMAAGGDAGAEESVGAFALALPAGEYPYLREAVDHAMRSGYDDAADFEFGLDLILDGLQRLLGRTR